FSTENERTVGWIPLRDAVTNIVGYLRSRNGSKGGSARRLLEICSVAFIGDNLFDGFKVLVHEVKVCPWIWRFRQSNYDSFELIGVILPWPGFGFADGLA